MRSLLLISSLVLSLPAVSQRCWAEKPIQFKPQKPIQFEAQKPIQFKAQEPFQPEAEESIQIQGVVKIDAFFHELKKIRPRKHCFDPVNDEEVLFGCRWGAQIEIITDKDELLGKDVWAEWEQTFTVCVDDCFLWELDYHMKFQTFIKKKLGPEEFEKQLCTDLKQIFQSSHHIIDLKIPSC